MDKYVINRGSQGAEICEAGDRRGYYPLIIISHDAPDADELEARLLRFMNEEIAPNEVE